jgi:hypothetical protein
MDNRTERFSMPAIYAALAKDDDRNTLIIDDILAALEAGRCPIVLTERRDHLDCLQGSYAKSRRTSRRHGRSRKTRSRRYFALFR